MCYAHALLTNSRAGAVLLGGFPLFLCDPAYAPYVTLQQVCMHLQKSITALQSPGRFGVLYTALLFSKWAVAAPMSLMRDVTVTRDIAQSRADLGTFNHFAGLPSAHAQQQAL
jgi:hypothetical protein